MGVQGPAFVQSIEPCPEIESGEGRVITGTFRHLSGNVYDVLLESEPHPIGVTGTHPIWSMDRLQWVPVKDLEPGEQVLTLSGTTEVLSILFRDEQVPVYNLEVEGDHVYRVGQSGVLVHNASNPCKATTPHLPFGFSNRNVTPLRTITVNYPGVPRPPSHPPGVPFRVRPPVTYTLTIVEKVVANLQAPFSGGSEPDHEIKWALTNRDNPDRIGYYDADENKRDSVGHIIDKKFGGEAQHNDDGVRNVFPQNTKLNKVDWNQLMDRLEDSFSVAGVCGICVQINFYYQNATYPNRPSRVYYRWWVDAPAGTVVPLGNLEGGEWISNRVGG